MNADRLLELFNQISEAPDAIARLRRFVLDLAVRGKLVEPDPTEGTGAELARCIAAEKTEKAQAGLIKPTKPPKGITHDTALEFPDHWQPLLMADILDELQTGPFGSSLKKSDYVVGGVPVINPASIVNEAIRPVAEMAVGSKTLERLASFKLQRGDIVMARRGEMGRCALVGNTETGWLCGTGSLILRPSKLLFGPYLVLLIGSPYSRNYLSGSAVGATMQNLNQNILLSMPIGLPPKLEQHRIVAKVDELMALCDRLEEARKSREETRDKLTAASLARLTAPDTTPEDFPAHARFALAALPSLTTRPDQIKTLRQTILNLAVRGKLVEQNQADEPASELLERIGTLPPPPRYTKRSPELIPGDCGLSINMPELTVPNGWLWVPLVKIARLESGHTPSRNRPDWWDGDIPWMGLVDARAHNNGRISETIQHTNEAGLANSAARLLPKGTVCFSRTASVGYVVIMDRSMATSQDFVNWVPTEAISAEWLQLVMIAERPAIPRFSKGAVHQTIYYPAWLSMHVALPPVAEQHRIVAKVDALMALCDRLEAALATTDTTRTRLFEALLHEALEPKSDILEAAE
ncbi:restriction endonuclease subunit S [Paracoccus seriniphilus]|uniref:Type I restriction enzyme, S subunit n=1 Tax=Paracoccus seriniphilus TaxID=184748 RepID=A0A239Q3L0_9RHOB|nr:restriction endonuclease subunit S [Paracoccus seriniphilus]WCR16281.1 restriction endonuclease subunit S [Paracoccus seriniphilus]SNT76803.1 type I restriction enzyme, S subunit [Paracoccus seriniphilus]